MKETRIKISSVIENQLPEYVKIEFPLVSEFLKQYYLSLETQGASYDLIQNIDDYIKVDRLTNLVDSTVLTSNISFFDTTINVVSTSGFPDSYGLLLIDSEIITYTEKTPTSFIGCVRGFSGITSLDKSFASGDLTFSDSLSAEHTAQSKVNNLSILFLQKFFKKLKVQFTPGFEDREFYSSLNEGLFLKQAKDFYSSKGTEGSFEILFRALYGKDVDVIRPQDYLIQPSDAQYKITKDLVVELIEGDISKLLNRTIYQDQNSFLPKSRGTVTQVEKIQRGEKEYYVISLDAGYQRDIDVEGTVFGVFSIHPKTLLITNISNTEINSSTFSPNSTSLDVDSTVGFPQSGELLVDLENETQLTITYEDKTLTQFLNCSGITQEIPMGSEIKSNVYAYGFDDSNVVKFRITGVLSDLRVLDKNPQFSSGDPIVIKTLGDSLSDDKFNNWFFNLSTTYQSESVRLLDSSNNSYIINFYDDHSFVIGDNISILPTYGRPGTEVLATVTSFNNKKSIVVSSQKILDLGTNYDVRKILSRLESNNYPNLIEYTTNIQNVYTDEQKSLYVAAPSLPTYLNQKINVNDRSISFSGTFSGTDLNIGAHPFYTGDQVFYRSSTGFGTLSGISDGFYFVQKINQTTIRIAKSRPNLYSNKFISVSGTAQNHKLEFGSFVSENSLQTKELEPQKLIRKISNPLDTNDQDYETGPGSTGILVNGVEILNYKSKDSIFYGPLESISPISSGSGYDVINPPVLQISDAVGSGATTYCSVKGSLERIDIVYAGFDYLTEPTIAVYGGNGFGAKAKANLVSFDHYSDINANQTSGAINPSNSTITFIEDHKFRDYEQVVYDPQGQTVVGGLSTNSSYYVSIIDSTKVKLHKTYSDSILGINTVSITNTGKGVHRFKSTNKKKKIGSISIIDSGFNYENKKTTTTSSGIDTASNTIRIINHGYKSGEIISYNYTNSPIVGLSSTSTYYVTKIDDDNFKLSLVGIATTQAKDINYKTQEYVNFTDSGNGTHIFNYEPISVVLLETIGISTLANQNFNAVLQPIFRGSIESVHIQDGGASYGSEEILNYNRQPEFLLLNGEGAQLTPIVNNGSIVDVIINNPGSNYNSSPNLVINGSGGGAILTPIVSNGAISSVKIISGGIGYLNSNTTIDVLSAGLGAKFEANIKSWNINLVERYLQTNQITDDDGILDESFSNFGLQYFHAYSPRKLRSSVLARRYKDGEVFYEPDLIFDNGKETTSISHSPIIGWSYDGNPIYGPYGYSDITGGPIKSMVSGYKLKLQSKRPSTSIYPIGTFVEDYEYVGGGDLDEYNGRFCTTPEYPDGIYAYFTTINTSVESTGAFKNYKLPYFPYFIGNSYKSKPIEFNFLKSSNQTVINVNESGWVRNTTPYNITKFTSGYQFLYDPNKVRTQISQAKSVSKGQISSIGIVTGGKDYQVNDKIIFKDADISSRKPRASVSFLKGKEINSVSVSSTQISNAEFYPISLTGGNYVAFSSVPHNFNNSDTVIINSNFESEKVVKASKSINILYSSVGIGSTNYTGLVTYFNVSGNLQDILIKENDIYQIGNEQVKILNIDPISSRVRVLRNQNGTLGISSYPVGIALTEVSRKLYFSYSVENEYSSKLNEELYFNPVEALGIGTTAGPGISTTLNFSNPGVGATQIIIPTKSIYIPNHKLESGDELTYSFNGGSSISVSNDGITSYSLSDNSAIYATKLTSDLIGISTYPVGLGTTGSYVGIGSTANLLYFTGIGSGLNHSFKTNYKNILTANISKNEVTVSTATTHGLKFNDYVKVEVISGITTQISVSYNEYNRRMIVGEKQFVNSDVSTSKNTITLKNHGLYTSQKVIYKSTSPSGGLQNEGIYYVVVVDKDTIRLSNSYFYSSRKERNIVDITTTSSGSILPINPPIELTNNNTLVFDLSSSSLSFTNNGILYSAFDFDFYVDSDFKHKFNFTTSKNVEVVKEGRVGIDTNALVSLRLNDSTPQKLYYKLTPINLNNLPPIKQQIIIDNEVFDNNSISVTQSLYNGEYNITGISSNSFKYILNTSPEKSNYDKTNAKLSYITNSTSAYGEIGKINVDYVGFNLNSTPEVERISSKIGNGSILEIKSNNIGNVLKTKIDDIGFGYSNDYSVRPLAKLPDILKIIPQSSFKSIGVTSVGRDYSVSPDLIVLDGLTDKLVSDVDLRYNIDTKTVNIVKNTKGLNNKTPKIIPINNTNGIKIDSITFIPSSKDVVVTLGASFSNANDFPFQIGDKVLVENVSVGVGTTAKGYNSSSYNYTLFTIVNTDPNIGGVGATVSYNLSNYLSNGEVPGTFNSEISSGKIIPEKYFPIFDITLEKNTFNIGEKVFSGPINGTVIDWNKNTETLKVSSSESFESGSEIVGESSSSRGIISNTTVSNCSYVVGSSSTVSKGWQRETGFLNNQFQRVHDNDYYQYFSYALRSQVPLDNWENAVGNLNHTAGFKKFGDLIIESSPTVSGMNTEQNLGDVSGIADLSRVIDLNCVYDFDIVKENNFNIDNQVKSDEIIFNSRIIQDYIESIGNRVLLIDDISDEFNSEPRPTQFSVVDSFSLDSRSIKYLTFVEDTRYTSQKQVSLVSLIHDGTNAYINQYGVNNTYYDMGSFDFSIIGNEGNLLFYPTKSRINNYNVSLTSFDIRDTITSIGSTNLGNSVFIGSATTSIASGISSSITIVGIASTYRSSKVLVQIGATNSTYNEFNEFTLIHNGSEVILQEYGQLNTSSLTSYSSVGIGTYHAYYSGSNINIDLIPYSSTTTQYNINSVRVSIANTLSTGIRTESFNNSTLSSHYTSIGSSATPGISTIASYNTLVHNGAYYIVSIEDLTNNQYQVSEVVVANEVSEVYVSEFGIIQTNSSIGSIGATITSGGNVSLLFTPNANIDVQVRTYQNAIGLINASVPYKEIDFTNSFIRTGYGFYTGSEIDVKRQFSLTHKKNPIFERYFIGNSQSVVDVGDDTITIPDHFFVTGEKIEYKFAGAGTEQAIGIATTSIAGVGTTDKLPSTLYIVKDSDLKVRVAASASDALLTVPKTLDITNVGVGTVHRFVATNQNARVLISIDNLIQSPIVSTSITSKTTKNISLADQEIIFSGTVSFFGGDLIKVDNEIMRINSVGVGSTNAVLVERAWMGSGISTHAINSTIVKVAGDYNIVDNDIHFITAPYGLTPIGSTTNPPDSIDFVGIETHSTFSGRSFIRSGISGGNEDAYSKNYIFDDISNNFNGISTTFTLKSNGSNISGISTSNAIVLINDIFQGPVRLGAISVPSDYALLENSGISSVTFTGTISSTSYDINSGSVPRGGVILSVGSTAGFGYQPLVSAGGTAIVSSGGTIQSISIGNSGSGYRSGVQNIVNVGVATSSTGIPNIEFIGTASISGGHIVSVAITNPGTGYTSSNPPLVIFDDPLSYSNIPLVYNSTSSGVGTEATIDIVVGQGSSVVSFEIKNTGYGYDQDEVLTVAIGGTVGIPTNTSLTFSEFQVAIEKTFDDEFKGWSIGDLQVIDSIDSLFDGKRVSFPIRINGEQTTIRSRRGSNVEVKSNLLIFLNNILQVPDQSYFFNGGSIITFSDAPRPGDLSKILFYRGSGDVDTLNVDVLESVKEGDTLRINSDIERLKQTSRLVTDIVSTDIVETNVYAGSGVTEDETLLRPVIWCRQTEDKIINGQQITKDRILYEPLINPFTNIIQNISVGSTQIFVESVKTFFDSADEYLQDGTTEKPQKKIIIISQDQLVSAAATAVVSVAGTISSVVISDGGVGYTTNPSVIIENPVGLGTTQRATATSVISVGGTVSTISISSPGTGYTISSPPGVLIDSPKIVKEIVDNVSYEGDFGIISGISTVSVGVASTGLVFDFFIPKNSFLRDTAINNVGIATTGISGIQTGYYFVVYNSNVGNGLTSINQSGSVVGLGTTFIDNVYQVSAVSIAQTHAVGVGLTYVTRVTVSVQGYNNLSGIGYSNFYGEYSWGRISIPTRTDPKSFNSYNNGLVGISTSAKIQRYNPLKYQNYAS
jgi:hypothetical protein